MHAENPSSRTLTYAEAIRDALDISLSRDPSVILMGLGVPDPKGVFGTTLGLQEHHGSERVMDMPTSENAMTGVVLGASITGLRPVITHQRIDFALLAMEQMVGQAAKWHSMFGGRMCAPLVVRLIVGRGWGQGPQHSQSLQAFFAHVPGLKVVMPSTPRDAKGLLIAAIEDDNPVIFIEHRWLHGLHGQVPEGHYRDVIGPGKVCRSGTDITIAASSFMTIEALRAAKRLAELGVSAEVVDIITLNPFDESAVVESVARTGHLIVADNAWRSCGFAAEVISRVVEQAFGSLKSSPRRITLPDAPTPTSRGLTRHYYPRPEDFCTVALEMLGRPVPDPVMAPASTPHDVPDPTFTGPF